MVFHPAGSRIESRTMPEHGSVLLLGHSSVSFQESGPGDSICERTEAELRRLDPGRGWECRPGLLYMSPGMSAYVSRSVEAAPQPDVVVLMIGEMHFTREYVVYRIRERWPRLYTAAVGLAQALTSLGGGGPAGAPSARGWLFRAPRWLAASLIGTAPDVRVEEAVALTKQTIDTLLRREGAQVVFFFSNQMFPPNIPAAEADRRRQLYIREISAYCQERLVPAVDPAALLKSRGSKMGLAADGWHEDAGGRQAVAGLVAESILKAMQPRAGIDSH